MKGYMLMKKDEKRERNSFHYTVFVNILFGKVVDKKFSSKFKLGRKKIVLGSESNKS